MTQATAANEIAKVELTQDLRSSQTFTVPAGIVLEIDLRGKILDVPLNVLGELILRYGELNQPFTGTGIVKCWGVEFTASSVATGNISNCEFISCVFPATLTSGNVTNCIISGSRGDSDSVLAIGAMFDCDVDLKGGVNSLDPTDSAIVISGDWTNLSNVGTGSNIIARNKNLSALVTSDGYSVLGRSGATSGTAQSLTAHVDGYVLMRRSGAVGFDQLTTADIPGLSTAITATKYVTTEHKTSNYTVTYADNGKTFTNKGATSLVIFTLPAAAMSGNDGYQFNFYCDGYTGLRVQATSTNNIVVGDISTDDDGYYQTYTPTQYVELFCYDNQTWYDKSNSQLFTNEVQNSNFRQSAGLSVVGRSANTTGDVADITAASDGYVLRRSGTTIGFGEVAQSAVSGLTSTLSALSASKISTIGSSTDNAVTRWDGTGGTAIQNSTVTISDTGEISGARKTVTIYTTNANLTSAQSDSIISNKGATALVTYTLPTPSSGLRYEFFVDGYTGITVATNTSGVYIEVDGYLSVNSFTSYTTGDKIILWAQDANGWHGTQSGSNHGDHGDITVQQTDTGDWYFIDNNVVSYNKIQQMSGLSVLGRATNSTGNTAEITAGTDGYFLGRSGTSLAFLPLPPSVTDHTLLSNIGTNTHAQIDSHIAASSGVHGISGSVVGTTDTQTLTNKTVEDGTFNIIDNVINSKVARFSAGNISNSTTRVFDFPDASGTLALTSDIIPPTDIVNSQIAIGADIALTKLDTVAANMALVSDSDGYISAHATVSATELGQLNGILSAVVGVSDTQTLTNKTVEDGTFTIIDNVINSKAARFSAGNISNSTTRVYDFPDASGVLALTTDIVSALDGYVLKAASSTDNSVVKWDGSSGRAIQDTTVTLSDTQELSGHKTKVVNVTTTATLAAADSGKHYTNIGATALVTLTLPTVGSALTGLEYKITNYNTFGIDLQPQTNEYIVGINYTATSPGTAMRLSAPGDSLTITPVGDGYGWYTIASNGREKISGLSVLGNATNTTGVYSEITAVTDGYFLGRSGTTLGFFPVTSGGSVSSVFGRTGVVTAQTNDYTWAQINKATSSIADITTRNHSDLSGVGSNSHATIDSHLASTSNPHSTTAAQVGAISTTLTDGYIIVGNASNIATPVLMSADATISNAGVLTISPDVVTFGKIQNSAAAGLSVIGRATSGVGDFAEIASSADGEVLMRSSGAIVWSVPAGGGDTVGDSSSTDNALAKFSGTSGKIIQNSTLLYQDDGRLQFTVFDGYIDYASGKKLKITQNGTEYWEFRDANGSLVSKVTHGGFGLPRISTTSSSADTAVYTFSNDQSCGLNSQGSGVLGVVSGGFHAFDFVDNAFQGVVPDPVVDGEDSYYGDAPYIFNEVSSTGAYTQPTYSWVETPDTGIGKYGPVNEFATFINGTPTFNFDSTGIYGMGGTFDPKLVYFPSTANKPAFTCRSSTQAGITMASDKINLITGDIIRYQVDGYNLIGQESDFAPALYGDPSPVQFGRKGSSTSGLQIGVDNVVTLYVNNNPALTCPDSVTVNGRTGLGYSWELKSSATQSDIIYTFFADENTGLGNSAADRLDLISGGTKMLSALDDGIWVQKESLDTSTSSSNLTVDANNANLFRWKASWTSTQTLSVNNLAVGQTVRIFVYNEHASAEPQITFQASSTTSGHVSVECMAGNGSANYTSPNYASALTWTCFEVTNIGSAFVGNVW
jgi:hypothetical protein